MMPVMAGQAKQWERELRAAGETPDAGLDIAHLALLLAACDRPGVSLDPVPCTSRRNRGRRAQGAG